MIQEEIKQHTGAVLSLSIANPASSDKETQPASPLWRVVSWLFALALLAGYALLMLAPIYNNVANSDFAQTYYPAAKLLAAGGDPFAAVSLMYKQPAILLAPFIPLTTLPLETARALWLAIETLLFLGGVYATVRALDFRLTDLRAIFTLFIYLSPNMAWGLMIGQSSVLIFFLQALGMLFLRSNKPFVAGLALGATILKPHMLAVELPILLSAPRHAWSGAVTSAAALLLLPELAGIHLFESFIRRVLLTVSEEKFNKLTPVDMFVNLGGGPNWLRLLGWLVIGLLFLCYAWLLWRVWRERRANTTVAWRLTPPIQQAMLAAFMFLPYTLAYDIVLAAGSYLWRFKANDYQLDRPLTWNLALLWLLPILTLMLHAMGVPTTLNPLLVIGLFFLTRIVQQKDAGAQALHSTHLAAEFNT